MGCFGRTPHPVHAHVEQVAKWVERLRPRRTLLTHMGTDLDWDWMVRNLPPDIEPAFDGLRLEVPEMNPSLYIIHIIALWDPVR